ncbi:hypothetical protein [Photobacterium kishitanii]|uniref:Uncharacterized protein n=1 Tax=Photobacterium kishitanii TaxID=318456 RepID=A0A2T3KM83_9GAMM|nr:hypothetical protein [Photobacterium kishitanii]PSV00910.1 hypothetical protein C9J27_02465 [Photobacterium kishitanii]
MIININEIYFKLKNEIQRYKQPDGNYNLGYFNVTEAALFSIKGITPVCVCVIDEIHIKNGGESIFEHMSLINDERSLLGVILDINSISKIPNVLISKEEVNEFIELFIDLMFGGIDQLSWMQFLSNLITHENKEGSNRNLKQLLGKIAKSKYYPTYSIQ